MEKIPHAATKAQHDQKKKNIKKKKKKKKKKYGIKDNKLGWKTKLTFQLFWNARKWERNLS